MFQCLKISNILKFNSILFHCLGFFFAELINIYQIDEQNILLFQKKKKEDSK